MGSKSSSSSSTQTHQYDNRVAADGEGIAIGAYATVDATTPEAWEFGAKALDFTEKGFTELVDLTGTVVGGAFSAIDSANKKVDSAFEFAKQQSQSEEANSLDTLIKVGLPIAAGAYVLSKVMK